MASFLLISDVFCPWCYGFSPVAARLFSGNPQYPVRVLSGQLVEERVSLEEMREQMSDAEAFFRRLAESTGREIGAAFLDRLASGKSGLTMYSPGVALALAILAVLDPGRDLEHLEAFQHAFYSQGQNVLSPKIQMDLAAQFAVSQRDFEIGLEDPQMKDLTDRNEEEALEIMGEFVLYPTLYWQDDEGGQHLLARGHIPYAELAANLRMALEKSGSGVQAAGPSCNLAGKCG